jgi:hypothetical protein
MAGAVGIEPTPKVLETFVLPLNYAPVRINMLINKWWRGTDSNRRTRRERIYSPPRLATSLPLHKMKTGSIVSYLRPIFNTFFIPIKEEKTGAG